MQTTPTCLADTCSVLVSWLSLLPPSLHPLTLSSWQSRLPELRRLQTQTATAEAWTWRVLCVFQVSSSPTLLHFSCFLNAIRSSHSLTLTFFQLMASARLILKTPVCRVIGKKCQSKSDNIGFSRDSYNNVSSRSLNASHTRPKLADRWGVDTTTTLNCTDRTYTTNRSTDLNTCRPPASLNQVRLW